MDILNPFDPAAVDKEYKLGDDMLYGQLARRNGDDLQGVVVFRRNLETGNVDQDWSSVALKYHGFAGPGEYDLLSPGTSTTRCSPRAATSPWAGRSGEATWSSPSPTPDR